ncbi:LamG domain-containing protein [Candidatus Dojkabacteria bacterium]|uniref:LamG domain-containing protein n=1 Tax=Candidatus Dojkabacteria bacterium TaxID=2099670 RepID=A0A5C7J6J7_9BACT|nr:MAG: LamG domain-containing protein [Candidatus Dojkabacteria bacterium]
MAITDNILAYWKLDGNSNDSVASYNGTDTSITYSSGNGKIIQGAGFNGSTSKIELSTTAFGTVNTFSISMWINVTSPGTRQGVFCKTDGASTATTVFNIEVGNTANKITFSVSNGATANSVTSTASISSSTWTHVVCTCDGTDQKIYINGSLDSTTAYAGGAINNITKATTIGQFGSFGSLPYTGAIDEVGYWDRAINSTEVSQIYNSGTGIQYPFVDIITAQTGVFTLTGYSSTLTVGSTMTASTGSFLLTGNPTIFDIRGWINQSKNTSTWNNQSKHF